MRKMLSAFSLLAALALAPLTAWGQGACPIQNQAPVTKTGTTYTVAAADICSMLVFTSASTAVTLPVATSLPSGFVVTLKNASSNALTVTPTTSTIDGGATATINAGASLEVRGNNVAYYSAAGGAGSAYQSGANILENGDFLVDQAYAGASQTVQTSSTRSIDRWYSIYTVSSSGGSAPTTQQVALSTGLTLGSKELKMTNNASGATSVTAGMITRSQESVEGSDVQDLNWNAATGGVPITASGWIKSSIASADLGISINGASTYAYVHDCVASGTASTWTFCSFTIPAPGAGTWTISTGNVGFTINIAYQCGSTFQTTANTWSSSGPFYCTANQTQVLGTNSSTVELFGWKVERGSTPTVFVATPLPVDLVTLRRYYRSSFALGTAPAQNSTLVGSVCTRTAATTAATAGVFVPLEPPMYAAPTITTYNPAAANANFRDVTGSSDVVVQVDVSSAKGTYGFELGTQTTALTAAHDLCIGYAADSGI
jgi:hypothetical protein